MATNISGYAVATVGTTATEFTFDDFPGIVGVMQKDSDSGAVFIGNTSAVTTSTAPPIPKGSPGSVSPLSLAKPFRGKSVWLIGDSTGLTVYFYVS